MNWKSKLQEVTSRYGELRIAIIGDFCLDRYFEIDPEKRETSIETGLPVFNVVRIRNQPGGAGTILQNLIALGIERAYPVGFYGEDGEGYELHRAMLRLGAVDLSYFLQTPQRVTFTYGKPLLLYPDRPPEEQNRLDIKNWTPTPPQLRQQIVQAIQAVWPKVDAVMVLEQTDYPETGVITPEVLHTIGELASQDPDKPIIGDSRRGLCGWPSIIYKMNRQELKILTGQSTDSLADVADRAQTLSHRTGRPVIITLAEKGILGATPDGQTYHMPALPIRGPIDIVGAGDTVSANLLTSLAAGADLPTALLLAALAASIVIHQLGTTGTATVAQILDLHRRYPDYTPRRL